MTNIKMIRITFSISIISAIILLVSGILTTYLPYNIFMYIIFYIFGIIVLLSVILFGITMKKYELKNN